MNPTTDEMICRRIDIRYMKLNLEQFYEFFTNLLNCLPIFADESEHNRTPSTPEPNEGQETTCVICFEQRNNIMLKCYV
jgi:hypothetical protein